MLLFLLYTADSQPFLELAKLELLIFLLNNEIFLSFWHK